ncbi:MAG TPA: hypothetical protein VLB84_08535 [Bacteroidia bacterium]|nr:hypothetical protein [Bacteroidia bacterium]
MANSHIIEFIQSLNSEEIKIVKKHLSSETKIKKLLNTLSNHPDKSFSDKELSVLLKSNSNSIRVLKSRLFNQAKKILLLDEHFENNLLFNERERIVFVLKKELLLAKSLFRILNQKKIETVKIILNKVIKQGKEYQLFDLLVEALILQKQIKGPREGLELYNTISKEIEFFSDCYKAVNNACDAYYTLILNTDFKNLFTKKQLEDYLIDSIKKMEIDFKRTKAQEVNYFMYLFKIALLEHKRNYHQACYKCKKLLYLLKSNKILYGRDRIGFAMGNLSIFSIYIGSYKQAEMYAKDAQQFHVKNSFNNLILKEQEFYALFYGGNYCNAIQCIEEIQTHLVADIGKYRKSKFIYFQAYAFFASNQFKDALQLLNKTLEIEKDKTGWNISVKILIILVFIKLNKLSEASRALGALRKYIDRLSKSDEVKLRDKIILKLLYELQKDGFKRKEKNKKTDKLIAELSDQNKPTSWNYYTPELIPFHEWAMTLPIKN